MKKNIKTLSVRILPFLSLTALLPSVASADQALVIDRCSAIQGLSNSICKIQNLLGNIVPVLVALGVVYFVWGVVTYVIGSDEEAKKAGKDRIIFGIIGLAVIISMWALVYILANTFSTGGEAPKNDQLRTLLPQ